MYPEVAVNVSALPNALTVFFVAVIAWSVWSIFATVREAIRKGREG